MNPADDPELVRACPECGVASVTRRRVGHECSPLPDDAPRFRCTRVGCGARFDEPVYREPKSVGGIDSDSLAATLDEMTVAEFDDRTEVDG